MPSQPIISASVPDEVVQELDAIARSRKTTRSVVIRLLLEYSLDRYAQHQRQFHEVEAQPR